MMFLKKYALALKVALVAVLGALALFFRGQAAQAQRDAEKRDRLAQQARADQLENAQEAAQDGQRKVVDGHRISQLGHPGRHFYTRVNYGS